MLRQRPALLVLVVTAMLAAAVGCQAPPQPQATDQPAADRPDTPAPTAEPDGGEQAASAPATAATPPPAPAAPPPTPSPSPTPEPDPYAVGAYGVAAGHPAAVDVGMAVLAEGGNAVDAAVAAAYAVSVVEPFASGIGGGGAVLVLEPGGTPVAYDYRDVVPQSGQIPAGRTGVPGFVAGMERLHAEHGSGDLARLIAPAAALAAEGVPTSQMLAERLRAAAGRLPAAQLPQLFPGGAALDVGDPLVQADLAHTLRRIADGGADEFYRGGLAEELAAAVQALDPASLDAYQVERREPVSGDFAGYRVFSAAPPLPGATLVQMLQIAEALGVGAYPPDSPDWIHVLAMTWRLASQFLRSDIADPGFVDVPVEALTDPARNAELASQITLDALLPVQQSQPRGGLDDGNTTHVSAVDADGTVVSMTNTLSDFWGSGSYALGFFLNNQLRNFGRLPGSPNEPPEAGKRTVAYSAPTIVTDGDGRAVLAVGSPGGRRIPNVLSQVLVRWGLHGHSLADAVAAPRFHHDGGVLQFEQPPAPDVAESLRARGYSGFEQPGFAAYFGGVQALEVGGPGELSGAADPRREGDWRADSP